MSTPLTVNDPVSAPSKPRELASGRAMLGALAGGAAGAVANIVLYFGALAAGVSMSGQFDPDLPPSTLPVFVVAVASIVPAIPAGGLLVVLNLLMARASKVYVPIAAVFLVLSMGGPFTLAGSDLGTQLVLALMHVSPGVAIVAFALRMGRAER